MSDIEGRTDAQLLVELADLREQLSRFTEDIKVNSPVSPKAGDQQVWRSRCCTETGTVMSKSLLRFTLTSVISVAALIFSFVQLSEGSSPELQSVYVSIISSLTALHMPSPLEGDKR